MSIFQVVKFTVSIFEPILTYKCPERYHYMMQSLRESKFIFEFAPNYRIVSVLAALRMGHASRRKFILRICHDILYFVLFNGLNQIYYHYFSLSVRNVTILAEFKMAPVQMVLVFVVQVMLS